VTPKDRARQFQVVVVLRKDSRQPDHDDDEDRNDYLQLY